MNRFRIGAGLLATVVAQAALPAAVGAQQPVAPATADADVLDRAKLDELLAAPDVLVLDVRRADEISAVGGFPVFLNIQASELDRFLGSIPRDRRIIPVSNHAARAKRAAATLRAAGFTVAGVAGVQDYEQAGGKVSGRLLAAPAIPGVVAAGTRIEVLREGLQGTEGPIALPDGAVLFTENRADRIVKVAPNGVVSTYLEKTGSANALAANAAGEIVAVQTAPAGVAVLGPKAKVLTTTYRGRAFNRPNDLAVARSGNVYFTDPGANPAPGRAAVQTAVYQLDPRGRVTLIASDIKRPNGIALSPDERTLYVADTGGEQLLAYTVGADGRAGARRDFAHLAGSSAGGSGADGIAVDAEGRVYVATAAGVQVFSGTGAAVGVIPLPNAPQNLAFGGAERKQLYVVGRGSVYRIATLTRGVDRPGK